MFGSEQRKKVVLAAMTGLEDRRNVAWEQIGVEDRRKVAWQQRVAWRIARRSPGSQEAAVAACKSVAGALQWPGSSSCSVQHPGALQERCSGQEVALAAPRSVAGALQWPEACQNGRKAGFRPIEMPRPDRKLSLRWGLLV